MFKRYVAIADTTISNAYKENLSTRATGSNTGQADTMEVFTIYAQVTTSSVEQAKALLDFDFATISSHRTSGIIPAAGSVSFYLKCFDAKHGQTLPKGSTLTTALVTRDWNEGFGLDLDEYTDVGTANWVYATDAQTWTTQGGDFDANASRRADQYLEVGDEDLEVDVTDAVEEVLSNLSSYGGFGVFLSGSQGTGADLRSYYTKRFFTRSSEFTLKRPFIEARWNSQKKDDRTRFYLSSSLASGQNNLQTLYLYNSIRGSYQNIPLVGANGLLNIKIYTTGGTEITTVYPQYPITGGLVSTGIYTASFALTTTESVVRDVWYTGSTQLYTGTIEPLSLTASVLALPTEHVVNVTNLKKSYSTKETATKFRVYVRNKNWNPNVYSIASNEIETSFIDKLYYKIYRLVDDFEVVPYGTGSDEHTLTSYDKDGNWFELDMSIFQTGYMYGMKFLEIVNGLYIERGEEFRFRVE